MISLVHLAHFAFSRYTLFPSPAVNIFFPLWFTLSHNLFIYVSEEKRTAQSVQQRLWELLAPAGLTEDSETSPWLHAYRRLLQEEGVDKQTQEKALLMQLWATQVSQVSEKRGHSCLCKRKEFQSFLETRGTWPPESNELDEPDALRLCKLVPELHATVQTWRQM